MISASAAPVVAALLAGGLIELMLRRRIGMPLDRPNERSLHSQPLPRSGGIAIMSGALAAFVLLPAPMAIALPALALACVSIADDWRGLPIAVRLAAHAAAACAFVWLALGPLPWWLQLVAALAVIWMTNLYNFMDGSDGLAGGMALIGFGTLAMAASDSGFAALALGCAAIAAAAAGFLLHNFPPARVFLGDSGSVPLGFLAGGLGALGIAHGAWAWWFPALVFSPFIVDATVTILRRVLGKERIWIAHRSHFYQRLVLAGWSRRRVALASYGLMVLVALSALLAQRSGESLRYAIILLWSAIYPVVLVAIERYARSKGATSR